MSYGFAFPTQGGQPGSGAGMEQIRALHEEVRQLKNAGSSRHEIGLAEGMLMVRHQVDQQQAYAILSRRSRAQGVHVRTAAQSVIVEMGFAIMETTVRPM